MQVKNVLKILINVIVNDLDNSSGDHAEQSAIILDPSIETASSSEGEIFDLENEENLQLYFGLGIFCKLKFFLYIFFLKIKN